MVPFFRDVQLVQGDLNVKKEEKGTAGVPGDFMVGIKGMAKNVP